MKRSVVWTAALFAAAVLAAGCDDSRRGNKGVLENVGRPKPFTLNNLAGESRSYDEYAKKETLLLCFFETTQKPSVDQVHTINKVFDEHKGGLAVAAVALDADAAAVQEYAGEQNLNFDVLIGSQEQLRSVAEDYGGANYLPTTLVVRGGQIIKRFIGYADERMIGDVLPLPQAPKKKKKQRKAEENPPEKAANEPAKEAEEPAVDEPKTETNKKANNARKNRRAGAKKQGQSNN